MELRYIFLLKQNSNNEHIRKIEKNKEHKDFMGKLFEDVTDDSFKFKYEKKDYSVNYKEYYNDRTDMFSFFIEVNETVETEVAKILCEIDKSIRRAEERKEYNIIVAYDEVSEFYCNKCYGLLNRFERKLRELVYLIVVKTFGAKWYDNTIKDIKPDLERILKERSKGKNESQLREFALQEMTLNDLEVYLFQPYAELDFNKFLLQVKGDESLLEKSDIKSILPSYIPKSLWERFFQDIMNIDDINNKLTLIREFRNKVAHSKELYFDDYTKCEKIVKDFIKDIEYGIKMINSRDLERKNKDEIISAFNNLSRIFENNMKELEEYATRINSVLENIKTHQMGICDTLIDNLKVGKITAAYDKS